ncbi:hypothetical protein VTK56DRAFT_4200 [Thermocarpiscus australiensis]
MIPDAEILCIIAEVFEALEIGITVKLNHRKILDGLFEVAGVPKDKIRTTSSAVDKLDKAPWDDVRKELLEKGLSEEVAGRVGSYVQRSGGMREMLENLESDAELGANKSLMEGVADMKLLASYLEAMDVIDKVSFDLSLARGLDYYTGLIYEVVADSANQPTQVGSIAAGGRYDDLVGMYGRRPLPCVGISFGVDRIFTLLDARRQNRSGSDLPSWRSAARSLTASCLSACVRLASCGARAFAPSSPPRSSRSRCSSSMPRREFRLPSCWATTSWRPARFG